MTKTFGGLTPTTALFQGDEIPIWQGSAAKRISKPNMKNSLGIAVSVLDYGADPTGVADSTAAFNAATLATIAMTGNDDLNIRRVIDVPPGDFKITGTVYLRYGQHLRGAGEGATRIVLSGATAYGDHIFKMGKGKRFIFANPNKTGLTIRKGAIQYIALASTCAKGGSRVE